MKKFLTVLGITLFCCGAIASNDGVDIDPCTNDQGQTVNNWMYEINVDGQTDKEGFLQTLDALSIVGFQITSLSPQFDGQARLIVFKFTPSSYENAEDAEQAKRNSLSILRSILGSRLECNWQLTF